MMDSDQTKPKSWDFIQSWLDTQYGGLDTYTKFQQFAAELAAEKPNEAAAVSLLSVLASRFTETYDGMPLTQSVAQNALETLKLHVNSIASTKTDSEKLEALNAIARSDLSKS